jgi:hypothetical protein
MEHEWAAADLISHLKKSEINKRKKDWELEQKKRRIQIIKTMDLEQRKQLLVLTAKYVLDGTISKKMGNEVAMICRRLNNGQPV